MRSIRARRSPAAASGRTAKGSTGARRKRDFVFMRGYFDTEAAKNSHGLHGSRQPRNARKTRIDFLIRALREVRGQNVDPCDPCNPWLVLLSAVRGSKRVADAAEECGALPVDDGVADPGGAGGERQREVVED